MKKLLTLAVAASLSVGVAKAQIELRVAAPREATAGDDFTVTLTIVKQNLAGFARFHQDLPMGFKAEQVSSDNAGAVFSFDDQRVRFLWSDLPENVAELKVSYRIRITNPRLKGTLKLEPARFTYTVDGERKSVEGENFPITVSADASVAPSQTIDLASYLHDEAESADAAPAAAAAPALAAASTDEAAARAQSSDIFAVRQKPYMVDNEYYAILKVTKGELSGYGKIEEEQLTPNFKVEAIETKGALFSTEGNKISFVWINLPSDNEFVIAYKVTPKQTSTPLYINGVFTFSSGGSMESVPVAERNGDFSGEVPVPPLAAAQTEHTHPQPKEQPRQAAQRGLVFKVQLLATKQSVGNSAAVEAYFAKLRITEPVAEEVEPMAQYAYKYVLGPYKRYEQAAAVRDLMWGRGVADAFVTCYYNGDRITIQEALMIANRKH